MRRCWHKEPLRRPTFTQLREEFNGIMCQDGIYFSFHSDEDIPCDHEVGGANDGAMAWQIDQRLWRQMYIVSIPNRYLLKKLQFDLVKPIY